MYIRTAAIISLLGSATQAQTVNIVTDILPVGALVESIAGDTANVTTLLQPGDNPHEFALRPSQARSLSNADIVIWAGADLSPLLSDSIANLASNATVVELLETDGWERLEWRDEAHDDHDDHAHEEHDDHHDHDEHAHDEHDDHHDEHAHGDFDPHAWLSPAVLTAWTAEIQDVLAETSPENATIIAQNATQTLADIAYANEAATQALADVRNIPYVVSHDAFGYFEHAFDIPSAGRIAVSDTSAPGAARLAEIKHEIEHENIQCIVTDPQSNPDWVAIVTEGTNARTVTIDPLGGALAGSSRLATESIVSIAQSLSDCLKG